MQHATLYIPESEVESQYVRGTFPAPAIEPSSAPFTFMRFVLRIPRIRAIPAR